MLDEAVAAEWAFGENLLAAGIAGLPLRDVRQYLDHVADPSRVRLGLTPKTGVENPLAASIGL
jgi:ribonucleoside-diphosphate reductase beta chain